MSEHLDRFQQLLLETPRTLFLLYGYRNPDGSPGEGAYFKLARSLGEALDDLLANPGVLGLEQGMGYLVADVIAAPPDGDEITLHVRLVPAPLDA